MDFFKRYSSIGSSQQQSAAETIQRLADRVETSTLLEDRRAAVLGLKGLSREYKKDVGEAALPALLKVLKEEREDQNMLKAVLETLTNLCTRAPSREGIHEHVGDSTDSVADKFSQSILDDSDDVISIFLELLGEADFYVRYYTVQLLGTLHLYAGEVLQNRVMVSPTGVGRLVDLLSDQRDIIRNEGIQLLIAMTEVNADIQKIVAFENAFDHLLGIVNEEGGVRGNIIVQDCLQLLHNLLNYNVSNQNFFRETSGIQKLPDLLITDPSQTAAAQNGSRNIDADEDMEWTAQHARNMLVVLDIIRMLIQPGNTNTESNQTAMQQYGLIPPLLQLALANEAPSSVRAQALYAIGDTIRSHQANQNLFQRILITAAADEDTEEAEIKAIPEPAIIIVIRLSVGKRPANVPPGEYYIVRAAAAYLLQAYVGSNSDAQLALAATLTPPGEINKITDPEQPQSAGSSILSVLLDWRETSKGDVWRVWFASLLLSTILCGNNECKEQALKISLGDESKGEDPIPLINEILSQARHATQQDAEIRVSIALLSLICVWLAGFSKGVAVALDESSNVSFLVEQINGSSGVNALVQGISAFTLGLIYEFDTEADTPMSREDLYPILSKRVGSDQLLIRVQRLRDSKEFQYAVGLAAGAHSNAYGGAPTEIFFDSVFTNLFKQHYESFRASVRLGPNETLTNPSYAYLQRGMTGYAGTSTPGSAPGTPIMGEATLSRSASPAVPAAMAYGAIGDVNANGALGEAVVPKSEIDALNAKLLEQEVCIADLRRELAEAVKSVTQESAESFEPNDALIEQEKHLRTKAESERDAHMAEIAKLREELDAITAQLSGGQHKQRGSGDEKVAAELESAMANLKLDSEKKQAQWESERSELQKKLANAEKQVVKAAAAVRNTNKKKEQQQASVLEALEKESKAKDEQITNLNTQVQELLEKVKQLDEVNDLKGRLKGLEKEQEDLLVYLADQDQQAKDYRAKLRKYGEDIPASDDEAEDDNDDE
ncbi:Vesicle-mediated ER to Golgi transport protein [Coemansia spiralis]|uniref:General vesicular transport factor p115 n=2 Tax=Coemansia TaxID=4863 RepID=A0A9W8GFI4_9FUNG|nr:p115 like vesicle tethering protein [Coemansia spiralis]KAJ1992596.1 Vesicle-mediated ER to Golgi transport protein [Coemansia umbellata]KAJ2620286.1 Vesicle-mediated ER to Golgi transport protein [Coemansia sp. RSA 1358]KAJ2681142.1 Vesicle-mediated ER to Golgi transport protein [Coemansia spiralis]